LTDKIEKPIMILLPWVIHKQHLREKPFPYFD
jgi:hypothetical protein